MVIQTRVNGTTAVTVFQSGKAATTSSLSNCGSGAQILELAANDYVEIGGSYITGTNTINAGRVSVTRTGS